MKTSKPPNSSTPTDGTDGLDRPTWPRQSPLNGSYECPICQQHFSETLVLRIPAEAPWYRLQRTITMACPHCHTALRWQALQRSRPLPNRAQSISLGLLTGLVFTLPFYGVTALKTWFPDFAFNNYSPLILLWLLGFWGYPRAPAQKMRKGQAGVFLPANAAPDDAKGVNLYLLSFFFMLAVLALCPKPALPTTWLTLATLSLLLSIASLVIARRAR